MENVNNRVVLIQQPLTATRFVV